VDIEKEESGIFKLHLKEWEDAKKQSLLKIESYRGRCIAAKTELYQLMGFYSLFQGVVFSAVCNGSKLSCSAQYFPMALSFLTFFATAVSVHFKLAFYKTEKSKFIKAEWDVQVSGTLTSHSHFQCSIFCSVQIYLPFKLYVKNIVHMSDR